MNPLSLMADKEEKRMVRGNGPGARSLLVTFIMTFVHDYVLEIIVKLGHHYHHDPTSLHTAGYLPETRRARRRC